MHDLRPAPGWYKDPADPTLLRWYDGRAWSKHTVPLAEADARAKQHGRPLSTKQSGGAPVGLEPSVPHPSPTPQTKQVTPEATPVISNARPTSRKETRALPTPDVIQEKIGFWNGKGRALELKEELLSLRAQLVASQKVAEASRNELSSFKAWMKDEGIADAHDARMFVESVRKEKNELLVEIDDSKKRLKKVRRWIREEKAELVTLRTETEIQGLGIFDFEHPAESSVQLSADLSSVRTEYKRMAKAGEAVHTGDGINFNGSAAQGKRFLTNMSKMLLRAYNAEAENAVKAVRVGNLETCCKRLTKAREQIEKSGEMIDLRVDDQYHRLRVQEIEIASNFLKAKAFEKELEREHRAELREQKRVEKELAAAREKYLKEQQHYENMLATLRQRDDVEGIARVEKQLADVTVALEDVDYRQANTRAGYVYVISNTGAFGEGVVKIGLTRRLDPMDRVRELGDASVPFRFDVHALFFAQDAVGVERFLHERFSAQRLNKVNLRREFFAVSPQQVLEALQEENVEIAEFTVAASAEEYLQSLALAEAEN